MLLSILLFLTGGVADSCKVSYSFTGADISPEVKTFSVYYFPNRARLVNPSLSQLFTKPSESKLSDRHPKRNWLENGDLISKDRYWL